jgi:hypothetical protein
LALEFRGRRRRHAYYYSAAKRDGKVIKTYHGGGAVGGLAAGIFAASRQRRAQQAAALTAERARLEPADRAMAALDRACRLMVEAVLTADGYHKHDYHWRRRRVRVEDRGVAKAAGRG